MTPVCNVIALRRSGSILTRLNTIARGRLTSLPSPISLLIMPSSEQTGQKRFSIIRSFHRATSSPFANGFCGMLTIFEAMIVFSSRAPRHLYLAAALIPVALIVDVLDGRIARGRHAASALGRELDSLADVVSFGVAPASIAFAAGVNTVLDQMILLFFVGCGVSRLAR